MVGPKWLDWKGFHALGPDMDLVLFRDPPPCRSDGQVHVDEDHHSASVLEKRLRLESMELECRERSKEQGHFLPSASPPQNEARDSTIAAIRRELISVW